MNVPFSMNVDQTVSAHNQAPTSVELFAGAGGLALGLARAGFHHLLLNELDKHACATLRHNQPDWPVLEKNVEQVDFSAYFGKVDVVSGGFPCQAFSYAGQGAGFNDTRGTLFFQFARAVQQIAPKVFMAENVRGLLRHDQGRTLATIEQVLTDLGYHLVPVRVLEAKYYRVPQKRERLFLIGIRADFAVLPEVKFEWPMPEARAMTLRDALCAGELFADDVPLSIGQGYPDKKKAVLDLVPAGGYWRDLPDDIQRSYMKGSYFLGGGKTGMARRLSWDEPSLTLTCSPSQNQTERCHPEQTRPLTVREYARIQTFPDDWMFMGSMAHQYKQIGNAVPVNLAYAMGVQLQQLLQRIAEAQPTQHC